MNFTRGFFFYLDHINFRQTTTNARMSVIILTIAITFYKLKSDLCIVQTKTVFKNIYNVV